MKNIDKTAMEFLHKELHDDSSPFGGISFIGETLEHFLDRIDMSYDTPMDRVNKALKVCGIEPINY